MGIFDGINTAPTFEKGKKLPDGGDSLVRIDKVQVIKSQEKKGVDIFVVEYIVEESNKAEIGGRYSWTQYMDDQNVAWPAIKQFVLAVFSANKERDPQHYREIENRVDQICEAACSSGYLNGQKVRVTTHSKKTKANRDFLAHNFRAA